MRYQMKSYSLPILTGLAIATALSAPAAAQQAQAQRAQVNSTTDIVVAQNRATPHRARLAPHQVRQTLQRSGYRRISGIQYVRIGNRRDFYRAVAWQNGRQYRLRVSDENGRIINRKVVGVRMNPRNPQARVRGVDRIEVRRSLVRQGYTRITNVRFIGEVRNDHFVADAWKGRRRSGPDYRAV